MFSTYFTGTKASQTSPDYYYTQVAPFDVAVDDDGRAFLAGKVSEVNMPVTSNAFQPACPGVCNVGFLSAFNVDQGTLEYSTCLGGTGQPNEFPVDQVFALATYRDGSVYLTGVTDSPDFPQSEPSSPRP